MGRQSKGGVFKNRRSNGQTQFFSRVRLFATPWTAAYQAPPFMGFSRQEHCSGLPLPSLDLIKLKTTAKEINKMKRLPTDWEKIFANNATKKELISKINKQLLQLNY